MPESRSAPAPLSAPVLYLTHPQVRIDPDVPVPQWGLSDIGRDRLRAFCDTHAAQLGAFRRLISSHENKAVETAKILGAALGLSVEPRDDLHENDRSATGYLPAEEFERVADAFFAAPDESVRGWERASDAQARIVRAVTETLAQAPGVPAIFVGHGAVGTLLACHLAGYPISRAHDQPPVGGGCWFRADANTPPDRWRTMEEGFAP